MNTKAFEEAAAVIPPPSDEAMTRIANLVSRHSEVTNTLKGLEQRVKDAKNIQTCLINVDLPEALESIGHSYARLSDGTEVLIENGVTAHISKERAPAAHKWLEDNGYGDIIKHEVKAKIPRGYDQQLKELQDVFIELGIPYTEKESVHPQTLKAFVRKSVESGEHLPDDLFGIFEYRKAKITPPKK